MKGLVMLVSNTPVPSTGLSRNQVLRTKGMDKERI